MMRALLPILVPCFLALPLAAHEPHGGGGGGDGRSVVPATYSLQFSAQPSAVVAPATFSVSVDVINDLTGLPEAPVPPFAMTLSTQGVGALIGTTTLVANTATVTFTNLRYDGLEQTSLFASAPGVTGGASPRIDFDRPKVEAAFPATQPVNTPFDLNLTFRSMLHPAQSVSVTGLSVRLLQTGGGGALQGTLPLVVTGASAVIPRVSYDEWDTLVAEVVTPYSKVRALVPMSVSLSSTAAKLFFVPNSPSSLTLTVRTGLNAQYAVTRTFLWAVMNGPTLVHSGSVAVANESTFDIAVPALTTGVYTLFVVPVSGVCPPFGILVEPMADFPGPVLMLRSGRVSSPYTETVAGVVTGVPTSYAMGSGKLPAGLALDPVTGVVSGTPTRAGTERFQVIGNVGGVNRPVRCTLSVFSPNETEIVAGQNFGFAGATPPYTALLTNQLAITPGNTFDNGNPSMQIRVWYPTQIASITKPMPLLVLHHGRGFNHTEYGDVLSRIASWGFVCVSSGDYYSFLGNVGAGQPGLVGGQPYESPSQFAEAGMESASGIDERLLRRMIVQNRTVGDPLFGKIDESRLFVAGHSRGGGAVHATQSRGFNLKFATSGTQIPVTETTGLAGYIGLMPFDLWYFTSCQPPSVPAIPGGLGSQPYNIARNLRRIPGLVFASELDNDLIYPICDQMGERRSTATCFLTIWGGNHNNTGDGHAADGPSSIVAATQRNILVQWMTAFMLRYGYDRLDLEGHLFGAEHAQSSHVGRVAHRDVSAPLMVLDGQNANVALNSLSLANVASAGLTMSLTDPYPSIGALPNATPRSVRIAFTSSNTLKTFRTTLSNVGLDVRKKRKLVFEIRQSGTTGFSWVSIGARATDISTATALVPIYDAAAIPDVSTFLPIHPIPGHSSVRPLNRFLQVEVPLSSFTGVDLSQLASITLEFTNTNTTSNILIDDLRIE